MVFSRRQPLLFILPFCAVLLGLAPTRAEACGGFFCGGTPIDQTGEKIAFAVKDGHVTATVLIQYAGNAKDFAWIVPVASKPTLSVGSNQLFSYLEMTTRPYFSLQWDYNPQCGGMYFGRSEEDATAGARPPAAQKSAVDVISQEQVGNYDAAILKATDAAALIQWLHDNKFDVPDAAKEPIAGYIGKDAYFVALKLQQNKGVGDLTPITLDFEEARACVPIRLTRIAAQPNMGITAYVLSDTRAIPENYKHVIVNETRIDWLRYGANYDKVVSEAIDEAGGLAFATEYAGETSKAGYGQALYANGRFDLPRLRAMTTPWAFVDELLRQGFPRDGQMRNLLREFIPMPAAVKARNVTEQMFYGDLRSYQRDLAGQSFDPIAFTRELETVVLAPLKAAQAMLDGNRYLTRLYTTMDPAEMVVDPTFNFNKDLGDVSNQHTAKAVSLCSGVSNVYDPHQLVQITLADGRLMYTHMDDEVNASGPAAQRVEQLPLSGPPLVLADNSIVISKGVKQRNDQIIGLPGGAPAKSSGCSSGGPGSLLPLGAMLALATLLRRRREA